MAFPLVRVGDFDFLGAAQFTIPAKADSVLIIDSNAVLADAVAPERLEPVARRESNILKAGGVCDLIDSTTPAPVQVRGKNRARGSCVFAVENVLGARLERTFSPRIISYIGRRYKRQLAYSGCDHQPMFARSELPRRYRKVSELRKLVAFKPTTRHDKVVGGQSRFAADHQDADRDRPEGNEDHWNQGNVARIFGSIKVLHPRQNATREEAAVALESFTGLFGRGTKLSAKDALH
jgi:hypothetical protein